MSSQYAEKLNSLGFYEASPKPTAEELSEHYRNKYYQQPQGTFAPAYTEEELAYFHNVAKVAAETSTALRVERTLLDLGCGEGYFAKAFKTFGWDVSCCDYSEYGIKKHNEDLLPFFSAGDIYESIARYKEQHKRFGLINLQNVLEHVMDPVEILTEIKHILGDGSSLRIRVPNDYSDFQLELVKRGCTKNTWFAPPEHLSYFNNDGLTNLLTHCGYKIRSLQADFPIELFLANPHSNYWQDRALGKGAHLTRVFCENFLIGKDINAYIEYSEAAAKLGFGRELIAYASPI
ncbi:MAG TPA: class I SAM-dependent methyltransferase [Aliidongia sp.]|nr:class I SAM-dependent methyltransferase [Aliidongia sp.]